ncbi:MAG: cadmium-translocating P-type ATPase [Clostridia bacterium]|nr:cadmium-translocating P-type ATPase [Clostridia bacterium]
MLKEKFSVTGMSCSACVARVERSVSRLEGVTEVTVSLLTNEMSVTFAAPCTEEAIINAVTAAGYKATAFKRAVNTSEKDKETASLLTKLIISIVLLLILMYVSMGHMIGLKLPAFLSEGAGVVACAFLEMALALAVMMIHGRFFVSGFKALIRLSPNMDTLVALGSGASFLYSAYVTVSILIAYINGAHAAHMLHDLYFEGAAMIVTLVTVGKTLESHSKKKTTDSYQSLLSLAPKTATLLEGETERLVPAEEVKVGDVFVVKTGEQIPVDGEVLTGACSVNEAYLTGESIPVDKTVGSYISASTIDLNGRITARATKVGEDTAFNKILELVKNVNLTKAPIARLADKVAGIFVPAVIGVALAVFGIWLLVGAGLSISLQRAVAVLVISCPCALGLATPVAIMVGSGVGAKHGVLYKNAESLETAGKINAVVLDKTGTLTVGMPAVTDVLPASGVAEDYFKRIALSLEKMSEHPLSVAITNGIQADTVNVEEFISLPGRGLSGKINGVTALGGNAALMKENGVDITGFSVDGFAAEGKTPLYFAYGNKLLGVIAVADKERSSAAAVVAYLKKQGITPYMLTGDNYLTANAIAERVGIDKADVFADVMPDDKREIVKKLKADRTVAMVGDGVNDAVALREADLGMAVSGGSFVAVDSADVVLMNDLTSLAFSFGLSKKTLKNIKENLFWAFIYNVVCIPIAGGALAFAGITLNPMIAAAAMSLSSMFVVTNALRLNRVKPEGYAASCEGKCTLAVEEKDNNFAGDITPKEIIMEKVYNVEGMMCAHCEMHVKNAVEAVKGVKSCVADRTKKTATVVMEDGTDETAVKDAIVGAGYEVR